MPKNTFPMSPYQKDKLSVRFQRKLGFNFFVPCASPIHEPWRWTGGVEASSCNSGAVTLNTLAVRLVASRTLHPNDIHRWTLNDCVIAQSCFQLWSWQLQEGKLTIQPSSSSLNRSDTSASTWAHQLTWKSSQNSHEGYCGRHRWTRTWWAL